jgi:hypothetical protein
MGDVVDLFPHAVEIKGRPPCAHCGWIPPSGRDITVEFPPNAIPSRVDMKIWCPCGRTTFIARWGTPESVI